MTFIKWWWKYKFLTQIKSEGFKLGVALYFSACLIGITIEWLDYVGFPIWQVVITLVFTLVFCALSFAIYESVKDIINDYKNYKENK